VIDYFDAMANEEGLLPDNLSEDGLHPNQEALYTMARTANQVLDRSALEEMETVTEDPGAPSGEPS